MFVAVAMAGAMAAMVQGTASASAAPAHRLGPARSAAGSRLSLSQAPAGLQAAVRRTLGVAGGSAFQQAKLTASDAASGDSFGDSIAIDGSTAVVGAYNKNSDTGAAYVFVRSGSAWSQQAKLAARGTSGESLGWSVAIYGSTAMLGAPSNHFDTGAAYMFVRSGSAWSQRAKLTAADAASGDDFGLLVALYGSTAVVGAPYKTSNTGAAYVLVSV
jgi:hypothetical protein